LFPSATVKLSSLVDTDGPDPGSPIFREKLRTGIGLARDDELVKLEVEYCDDGVVC
jgi:hypothetical protein